MLYWKQRFLSAKQGVYQYIHSFDAHIAEYHMGIFRIVRVDGSSVWRSKAEIDQYLAADVIYKDRYGQGYLAKL